MISKLKVWRIICDYCFETTVVYWAEKKSEIPEDWGVTTESRQLRNGRGTMITRHQCPGCAADEKKRKKK